MFKLLEMNDIINKRRGMTGIIECHGPSANVNRNKINELQKDGKLVAFGTNEWFEFENRLDPHYWIRAHTGANGGMSFQKNIETFNKFSRSNIPIFNAEAVDKTVISGEFIENNLKCPYLPYDTRHFNGLTCEENYRLDPENYLAHPENKFFKFVPDCCERVRKKGRLTVQEELQKYTGYDEHFGTSGMTVALTMIAFSIIMGCNPIYLNGIDLDYFGEDGVYANLKDGSKIMEGFTPGPNTWKGWRRNWTLRDMNIINESAKKIGVKIINLNKNTWYKTFDVGNLNF